MTRQLIKIEDAALLINKNSKTIRNWINKGFFKKPKLGYIYLSDLEILNNTDFKYQARFKWNYSFFQQELPEVYYWAGFIMADGNISKDSRLQINLAQKDKKHLELFAETIELDKKKIRNFEYYDKLNKKIYYKSLLSLRLNSLFKDLYKFGIIPCKTYNFIEPKIPKNMLPHYLRGYFDGDGGLKQRKSGYWSINFICNYKLSNWFIKNIPIKLNIHKRGKIICCHETSNKDTMLRFYQYCVPNTKFRMERKWKPLEQYLFKYFGDKVYAY